VLDSEVGSLLLRLLHGFLKEVCWVSKLELWNAWEFVWVSEEWILYAFVGIFIVNFCVYTGLGLVHDPFTNEKLVLVVIEVTALAFTEVIDPVTFKMVAVSLCEDAIAITLALMPLAFIDVLVGVDHSALTLWEAVDPVTVVSVTVLVEESSTSVLLIFIPVTGVLTAELGTLILPVGSLAVSLIDGPHALIFVSILVELDAEALLAVIAPVANVLLRRLPDLTLD